MPNGGGRAAAQASGAGPRPQPPLRHRRQAASPAAPRSGKAAVHRQGRRRHRAGARGRRTGSRLPQGPQSLPPRLQGAQRRDLPRLAQEGAAALAAHVAPVARLAGGDVGARQRGQGAVAPAGRGPRLLGPARLCRRAGLVSSRAERSRGASRAMPGLPGRSQGPGQAARGEAVCRAAGRPQGSRHALLDIRRPPRRLGSSQGAAGKAQGPRQQGTAKKLTRPRYRRLKPA